MKKTTVFSVMAMAAIGAMVTIVPPSCSKKDNGNPQTPPTDTTPTTPPDTTPVTPDPAKEYGELPGGIKGTDFHIIYMDAVSAAAIAEYTTVPVMMRDYQVWDATYNWNKATSGPNAFGEDEGWVSWVVADIGAGWSGGAIMIKPEEGFETAPDLSGIDNTYTLHLAIKSPSSQPTAGHVITFVSESGKPGEVKLYFGPEEGVFDGATFISDYAHDGVWHHFEVPASHFLDNGLLWTGPIAEERSILVFLSGETAGNELNLDAVFFYKKVE
ncbi:hypothetical protein AGMMS4956_12080 [Bacteroidia bacterium]|nr:hypothetical protein AGMMS4956_12080 [Bacteroidia bacterium]